MKIKQIKEELKMIKFSLGVLNESISSLLTLIAESYKKERISSEQSMDLVVKLANLNNSIKAFEMYNYDFFENFSIEEINEEDIKSEKQKLDNLLITSNNLSNEMFKLIEPK